MPIAGKSSCEFRLPGGSIPWLSGITFSCVFDRQWNLRSMKRTTFLPAALEG